jgi:hypothetical protein
MYKRISLEAALTTLHGLALRSDKIGDGAKSALQVRLPKLPGAEPLPCRRRPAVLPPSSRGTVPGASSSDLPPRRRRPACRRVLQRTLPAHHLRHNVR